MDDGTRAASGAEAVHLGFSVSVSPNRDGNGASVTVIGELDQAAAARMQAALERAIAHGGGVELDLRACSFIDSSGIAALVAAARELHEDGRVLAIRGARERVRQIFELAGLLELHWIVLEP